MGLKEDRLAAVVSNLPHAYSRSGSGSGQSAMTAIYSAALWNGSASWAKDQAVELTRFGGNRESSVATTSSPRMIASGCDRRNEEKAQRMLVNSSDNDLFRPDHMITFSNNCTGSVQVIIENVI